MDICKQRGAGLRVFVRQRKCPGPAKKGRMFLPGVRETAGKQGGNI